MILTWGRLQCAVNCSTFKVVEEHNNSSNTKCSFWYIYVYIEVYALYVHIHVVNFQYTHTITKPIALPLHRSLYPIQLPCHSHIHSFCSSLALHDYSLLCDFFFYFLICFFYYLVFFIFFCCVHLTFLSSIQLKN